MKSMKRKLARAPAPLTMTLLTAMSSESEVLARIPRIARRYTITPITAAITRDIWRRTVGFMGECERSLN